MGDPAGVRLVRRAARRPRDRGGLHPAAEHAALRVVDPGARGRQARALREADEPPSGRRRGGVRRGRARRALPDGGVHVPPQPADGEARRARRAAARSASCGSCARRSATRSSMRTTSGCAPSRRWRADGRRVLLRQRLAAARRASRRASSAQQYIGADRDRLGVRRDRCGSRATCSRSFDCGTTLPERDELEAIGTEGSLFLDDPWHCQQAR